MRTFFLREADESERDVASNVSTEKSCHKQLRVIDRWAWCGVAKNCRPTVAVEDDHGVPQFRRGRRGDGDR
jgi:hypothetical protein